MIPDWWGSKDHYRICDVMEGLESLPDEVIDSIVTSPPYWDLRDYDVEGQMGMEESFETYITNMGDVFDQVKRVLKNTGTCFINLGDKFWGGNQAYGHKNDYKNLGKKTLDSDYVTKPRSKGSAYLDKCLVLLPYRLIIELINRDWILRNRIIWYKPNCIPDSTKDRFTVDFEEVLFFVKSNKPKYWTNDQTLELVTKRPKGIRGVEGIDWKWTTTNEGKKRKVSIWTGHDYYFEQQFEPIKDISKKRLQYDMSSSCQYVGEATPGEKRERPGEFKGLSGNMERNMRCVWRIPPRSYKGAHFAVFPEELPERPIKAGCPQYVCSVCGMPRSKEFDEEFVPQQDVSPEKGIRGAGDQKGTENNWEDYPRGYTVRKFKGWSQCSCHASFKPGIVLDPFLGSGTTAWVARKLNRLGLGFEINPKYEHLIRGRIMSEFPQLETYMEDD